MVKRAVIYTALAFFVLVMVSADSGWEGNAVVGRYGAFPTEGRYGASNSFARNTVVKVTNLETGRSVEVIIATRVREPGVFLSLSEEAAEQLGMDRSAPARVRVTPVETRVVAPPTVTHEQPFSADPDLNPLAELGDPGRPYRLPPPLEQAEVLEPPELPEAVEVAEVIREPELPEEESEVAEVTEVPEVPEVEPVTPAPVGPPSRGIADGVVRTAAVVPTARAAEGDDVGSVEVPRAIPEQPPLIGEPVPAEPPTFAPPPAVAETNRMEEAVAAVRGRTPPKELHPPPREDEVFTFLDVPREISITRPVEHSLAEARLPDEHLPRVAERPAAESLGKLEQPRAPLMVELPPAEPPQEIAAEPVRPAEPEENGVILRLEPADPRPAVTVDEWARESLPLQAELDQSSYYLQVGAFVSPRSARNVIDRMEATYPFTVTAADQNDRTLYRVFIGPLSQDETGVVLYRLRAQGYRDAFVRFGGA